MELRRGRSGRPATLGTCGPSIALEAPASREPMKHRFLEAALDAKHPVGAVLLGRAEIAVLSFRKTCRRLIPTIAPISDVAALDVEGCVTRQLPTERKIELGDLA